LDAYVRLLLEQHGVLLHRETACSVPAINIVLREWEPTGSTSKGFQECGTCINSRYDRGDEQKITFAVE
jgi:hypothetical protein